MSCSGSRTSVFGVLGKKLFGADDCLAKRVLEEVEVGDTDGEAKKSWAPCELIGIDLTLRRGLRGCLSPEVPCFVGEAMKGGSGNSLATDVGDILGIGVLGLICRCYRLLNFRVRGHILLLPRGFVGCVVGKILV